MPHVTHNKWIPSWASNLSKVRSYECNFVNVYFSGVCIVFIRDLVKKNGGRGKGRVAYRSSGFF